MHRHPKLIWLTCSTAEKRKVVHEINFSYSFSLSKPKNQLTTPSGTDSNLPVVAAVSL